MSGLTPWRWNLAKSGAKDPFAALQHELNRTFENFFDQGALPAVFQAGVGGGPKLDLSETPNEFHVHVELPGLTEQEIDVELTDDVLKIRGEKQDKREATERHYHRVERVFGSFERVVPLPAKVTREGVSASFKNGVLEVTLPKAKPTPVNQKIAVTGGA